MKRSELTKTQKLEIDKIVDDRASAVYLSMSRTWLSDLEATKKTSLENKEILQRLYRNLFGEDGSDKNATISAKASIAYDYVKRNKELKIDKRSLPAIEFYEDWEKEGVWKKIKMCVISMERKSWFSKIFGVTNIVSLIGLLVAIYKLVEIYDQIKK